MITVIEQHLFRAWPALTTRYYDGWLLRFAGGYTRRSNSVNPFYGSSLDVQCKILQCEEIFAEYQLAPCFRLTQASYPENLGEALAQAGYAQSTPTSVQTRQLDGFTSQSDPRLQIERQLSTQWLDESTRLNKTNPRFRTVIRDMLECMQLPHCFMSLKQDNQTLATGLAVCDGAYVGLFQIVIDENYRRQGLGTLLTSALLGWGKAKGATIAHLQVVPENTPAIKMYEKMGFKEQYQYWYWEKSNFIYHG